MISLMAGMRAAVRWASLALLFFLIATPLAQIVMRTIFNVPMAGAEELARYFLICMSPRSAARSAWRNSRLWCHRSRAGCCNC